MIYTYERRSSCPMGCKPEVGQGNATQNTQTTLKVWLSRLGTVFQDGERGRVTENLLGNPYCQNYNCSLYYLYCLLNNLLISLVYPATPTTILFSPLLPLLTHAYPYYPVYLKMIGAHPFETCLQQYDSCRQKL